MKVKEPETGKIYKLYFKSNPNTVYIGKTQKSLKKRFNQHKSAAKNKNHKSSPKLYNWIRKHIETEELLIELLKTGNDLDKLEKKTIKEFRENKNYIVKNTADGGQGLVPGFKFPEEVGQQARERNLKDGRWKGEKNPFYKKEGALNHKSKKTYQYSLSGDFVKGFESARLAQATLGLKKETRLLHRAMQTEEIAYGYQWRNYKVEKIDPKEYRNKIMSEEDKIRAQEMYDADFSVNAIHKVLGIGRPQIIKKMGWPRDIKGQASERTGRMISKANKGKSMSKESNDKRIITSSKGKYFVYKNVKLLGWFISSAEASRQLKVEHRAMDRIINGSISKKGKYKDYKVVFVPKEKTNI